MTTIKKLNQFDLCYDQGHPITLLQYKNILNPSKRIILTSDLHTKGREVFEILNSLDLLNNAIVICAGDMVGDGNRGTNMDAVPLYKYILSTNISHLFFVQGNHDLFTEEQDTLVNKDGTYCCLHNKVVDTVIGRIGGINGIIGKSDQQHHKFTPIEYNKMLTQLLKQKLDILVTHQPPEKSSSVKLHIFGHHHLYNPWRLLDKQLTCNVDARVILLEANNTHSS